ncbi:hypothetical protein LINPERPRIM_LOCUS22227, partial [Linum perenne]
SRLKEGKIRTPIPQGIRILIKLEFLKRRLKNPKIQQN